MRDSQLAYVVSKVNLVFEVNLVVEAPLTSWNSLQSRVTYD